MSLNQPSVEEKNIDYAQYKSLSEKLQHINSNNIEKDNFWIQLDEEQLRYLSEK